MTTLKLSRNKIRNAFGAMNVLIQRQEISPRLDYALRRNQKFLKDEIDTINEATKKIFPEGYQEFEEKRIALCKEYSKKKEDGQPVLKIGADGNSAYQIEEERTEEFNQEITKLSDSYPELIKERDNNLNDFEKFLDEEIEIQAYNIPLSSLDNLDNVSKPVMIALFDFIDGDK